MLVERCYVLFTFILVLIVLACNEPRNVTDVYTSIDSTSLQLNMIVGNDTDSVIFAGISDAFLRSDSHLIVIEGIRQQVTSVNLSSFNVQIIGRHGPGPNEYNTPVNGCIVEDGSAIAIADQSKVIIYSYTDTTIISGINMFAPLSIMQYSDNCIIARIVNIYSEDNNIIGKSTIQFLGNTTESEVVWSDSGNTIDLSSINGLFGVVFFGPSFTVDFEYNIYIAERNARHYQITKIDRLGNYIELVSEYFSPVQKSESRIQDEIYVMESFAIASEVTGPSIKWIPQKEYDLITDIDYGPDGNLWVRRGYSNRLTYDIFDTNGSYIKTIVLAEDFDCSFWSTHVNQYGVVAYDWHPERSDCVYIVKFNSSN